MAEHASSETTWFVTLTYGGGYDNPQAYVLDRSHIREFMQSLRRRGHIIKPVAVGEFGTERNRAHWHLLIFWKNEPPDVPMGRRFTWTYARADGSEGEHWPYGWVQCEIPRSNQACMGYVLSYLDKKPGSRGEFSFGKRPAVGEAYMVEFAREKARQGLALFPRGPVYQVEGNLKDRGPTAGRPYDYWVDTQSAIFERMIAAYLETWAEVRPGQIPPPDKFVTQYCEGASALERVEKPDVVRQRISILEHAIANRLDRGGRLEIYSTDEENVYVYRDPETGLTEVRQYNEVDGSDPIAERHILWRKSVGHVAIEQPEGLRKLRQLLREGAQPEPEDWTDRAIMEDEERRRPSGRWTRRDRAKIGTATGPRWKPRKHLPPSRLPERLGKPQRQ